MASSDYWLTFRNYLSTLSEMAQGEGGWGTFRHRYNDTSFQRFGGDAQESAAAEFAESINLSNIPLMHDEFKKVRDAEATVDNLAESIGYASGNIDNPANRVLNARLQEIMSPSDDFLNIQDKLEALNADLLTSAYQAGYNPKDKLHEYKAEAIDAIKAHHQEQINQVSTMFADAATNPELTNLLTRHGEITLDDAKKDMLAKLKQSHEASFDQEKFEEAMNKKINAAHVAAMAQRDKIFFLQNLALNENMKKLIHQKAMEKGTLPSTITIGEENDPSNLYKDLELKDFPQFETAEGVAVSYDPDKNAFQAQLPMRPSPFYTSGDHKVQLTLMTLAYGIKASGHDSITMKVNHADPEHAEFLAKEAYAACIAAGFPPDKITIKQNGEKVELSKLFAKSGSEKKSADDFAKRIDENKEVSAKARSNVASGRAAFEEKVNEKAADIGRNRTRP